MSSLYYQFDAELAKQFGVDEAILLNNLIYWIRKNKANNKHYYNGTWWTYNSSKAFSEMFEFWTEKQIKRIIKSLYSQEVILISKFNLDKYDRTNWYAICNSYIDLLIPNGPMHWPKRSDGEDLKDQSSLDLKDQSLDIQLIKHQLINTVNKQEEELLNGFSNEEQEAIKTFLQYKKEKKSAYTPTGLKSLRSKLIGLKKSYDLIDCIHSSMAFNYQGVFPPKKEFYNSNQSQSSIKQALHRCNSLDFSINDF